MNSNARPFVVIGVAILVLFLLFWAIGGSGARWRWNETYKHDDGNPYGTKILYSILTEQKAVPPKLLTKPLAETTLLQDAILDVNHADNYVLIGESMYYSREDIEALKSFVEAGNNAFLMSRTVTVDLMLYVYFQECAGVPWQEYNIVQDSAIQLEMMHLDLAASTSDSSSRIVFRRNFKPNYRRWLYFDEAYFCQQPYAFSKLGTFRFAEDARPNAITPQGVLSDNTLLQDQYVNFARMDYGDNGGAFYFHTNPIAFTNLYLSDSTHVPYIEDVLSHFGSGEVLWDIYHIKPEAFGRRQNAIRRNDPAAESQTISAESPLRYVLAQPSLRWAWYLLVASGVLYLVFRAKRRQRIVPVLETNENTSTRYVSMLSALYYQRSDHGYMVGEIYKQWLESVRERYSLPIHGAQDEDWIAKVAQRAELPEDRIEAIVNLYTRHKQSIVSADDLMRFNKAVQDVRADWK